MGAGDEATCTFCRIVAGGAPAHVVLDGLRGFFWPRTRYADDAHAAEVAARLRAELET